MDEWKTRGQVQFSSHHIKGAYYLCMYLSLHHLAEISVCQVSPLLSYFSLLPSHPLLFNLHVLKKLFFFLPPISVAVGAMEAGIGEQGTNLCF